MIRIDELIQEFCPNGVEFKHIWEVTTWDKKFNAVDNKKQAKTLKYAYLLASDLRKLAIEGGDVKLLSTGGEIYGWTSEELAGKNISEGEIVAIPWGGRATIQYHKGKFVTADNRIATSLDVNYLDNKFLYYFMLCNLRTIQSFYRGSGIQHPSMAKVLDMKLPIPPLEVQKEIVSILDKFTQLEAELSAELEARRKQYEYYRNQLLAFEECGRVQWKTMADIGTFYGGLTGKSKSDFLDGNAKFITFKNIFDNISTKLDIKETVKVGMGERQNAVRFGDILFTGSSETPDEAGMSSVITSESNESIYLNSFSFGFRLNDEYRKLLNPHFAKFLFRSGMMRKEITKTASGVTRFNISKSGMAKIMIPIPPIIEQNRITSILDNFEKLVNDISEGLPAELKARRQQYEYYRNKLLTFQELSA